LETVNEVWLVASTRKSLMINPYYLVLCCIGAMRHRALSSGGTVIRLPPS